MKTIRSFLAVNLSLETARAIAEDQKTLKTSCEAAGADVKWVPPQNMHVTIRFLGQVTEPMIAALQDNLEAAAKAIPPFSMDAAGLGAFPDAEKPKVLWVGVSSPDGNLQRLYEKVSEILEETGFKTGDKPFRSHVTIGRVKTSPATVAPCLEDASDREYGRTEVRDLVCYRSDLTHRGGDYHLLWKLPLKGRATTKDDGNARNQGGSNSDAQGANDQ